jgi:DNA-binding protein
MSNQITEAFVKEFSSNVYMLSQQKGSRLRPYVRQESIKGKAKAFDRIGLALAQQSTGRHADTPQIDTPHSRRWCYLADYDWADLVDDMDKIRILNEPTSEYVMAAMWSLGRSMDDVIIAAADASVNTGEEAASTASHPNSQKIAANDGVALSNLNVNTLILIKSKFGSADVDPEIPLHIAVAQSQLDALLQDDQVTNADYASVKALVKGEVDTFMGFKFHRLQRLGTQTAALSGSPTTGAVGSGSSLIGTRKIIAWAQDGIILGIGQDMKSRVSERADKRYSVQAYASMSLGAVRMEEEKVVIGFCTE